MESRIAMPMKIRHALNEFRVIRNPAETAMAFSKTTKQPMMLTLHFTRTLLLQRT